MLHMTLNTVDHEPNRGDIRLTASERPFASGADGYFLGGKVVIDGRQYQVSCNVIRVGSKDEAEAAERKALVEAIQAAKKTRKAGTAVAVTEADAE